MQDRKKIQQAYEEYGTIEKAAEALGIARSTFHYHLNKNKSDDYTLDPLPDSDIPIDDIVDHLHLRFQKRKENKEAQKWLSVI